MRRSWRFDSRRLCCAAPITKDEQESDATEHCASCIGYVGGGGNAITGKFVPLNGRTHFIIGQDYDTVKGFVHNVLPNPSGTTSYTEISNSESSLHGLDKPVDYGAGTIHAASQMALVPNAMLVLGVCIRGAVEDIVMHRCDASIDRFGEWIRSAKRPVFLRIGYEFDGPWNDYDPELYKLAFKWIVARLRFRGVQNFASVWQSSTYLSADETGQRATQTVDQSFVDWYPGNDVVDWMGTSYLNFNRNVHDAFLNFARSKGKPLMIAEAAPQCYDIELGTRIDHLTNEPLVTGLTGRDIWYKWYKPFFRYIKENRDVIRAVAYINTPWKKQRMWKTGGNGFWGDSRIQVCDVGMGIRFRYLYCLQVNESIRRRFLKELSDDRHWLLASSDFLSKINTGV